MAPVFILLDHIINRLHLFCFIFPQIQTRTYLTGCLHALHFGAALTDGGEFSEAAGLIMMLIMLMMILVILMLMVW